MITIPDPGPSAYRDLRRTTGLTQRRTAELLGVSRSTIVDRERGSRDVKREHMLALVHIAEHLLDASIGK